MRPLSAGTAKGTGTIIASVMIAQFGLNVKNKTPHRSDFLFAVTL
jgi:hypothetical protein